MSTGSSYEVGELALNTGLFLSKDQAVSLTSSCFINRTVWIAEGYGLGFFSIAGAEESRVSRKWRITSYL